MANQRPQFRRLRVHLAVEERLDAVDARLDGVDKRLDAMDARLDGMDEKIESVRSDVQRLDRKIEAVKDDVRRLDGKIDEVSSRVTTVERKMDDGFKRMDEKLDTLCRDVGMVVATVTEETDREIGRLERRMKILSSGQ